MNSRGLDVGLSPGDRFGSPDARYARAPDSESDPERGSPQGFPPTRRPPQMPGAVMDIKEMKIRTAVVAACTLLGVYLLFSTGEWRVLLMNLSFLPLFAVLLNLLVLNMKNKTRYELDDIFGNIQLDELLTDTQNGVNLVKSAFGELQGKDWKVEGSKMMKQAVMEVTPVLMDQMSLKMADVMAKQMGQLGDAVAFKAAREMENGPGKSMRKAVEAVQNLQSSMDSKGKEWQAFEQKTLASLEAQQKTLELLTKTAAAEEGSIATKSTADTEAVPDSRAEADKRKTGRIDSPSRMEPASGSYDKDDLLEMDKHLLKLQEELQERQAQVGARGFIPGKYYKAIEQQERKCELVRAQLAAQVQDSLRLEVERDLKQAQAAEDDKVE